MLNYDLVVFSHLRWDFVFQRPQHLLSRAARERRVFFVEEAVHGAIAVPRLNVTLDPSGVVVCVPQLPFGTSEEAGLEMTAALIDGFLRLEQSREYVLWFYTPMALPAANRLRPRAIVYDCMDELSNFKFAPPVLRERELELLDRADVVFTGGQSLWEAKRTQHANCFAMPSSVDAPHFARARRGLREPEDLAAIPHPRVGFCGVVDERMNLELLAGVASALPDVHFVILGPVVKIDPNGLPHGENLHYLGQKSYDVLPRYLAHWDVAMMPFAINDSTRFISPTKTPEYLAAGKPVVSTPIRDVVSPYADLDLVLIGHDIPSFAAAVRAVLEEDQSERRSRADAFVGEMSWDVTWRKMEDAISSCVARRSRLGLSPATGVPRPMPIDQGLANSVAPNSTFFRPTSPASTASNPAKPAPVPVPSSIQLPLPVRPINPVAARTGTSSSSSNLRLDAPSSERAVRSISSTQASVPRSGTGNGG